MMKYTIYKTTNLLNGMFYIGKHQTEDLNDTYLGSGVYLKRAITKYGKCNFKKEVLYVFDSEEEMNAKEKEIINESLLKDPLCYNLMLGGEGGDTWSRFGRKHSDETKKKISEKVQQYLKESGEEGFKIRSNAAKCAWETLRKDPKHLEEVLKIRSENAKKVFAERRKNGVPFHKGYSLSDEARKHISEGRKAYYDKVGRKQKLTKPYVQACENTHLHVVNNGQVNYKVNDIELPWYLANGYTLGFVLSQDSKTKSAGKGKKIVSNVQTKEIRRIDPSELQDYLNNGWQKGYLNKKKFKKKI